MIKKSISVLLVLVMVFGIFQIVPFTAFAESDPGETGGSLWNGSGTEEDPYQIYNYEDLIRLRISVGAGVGYKDSYFKLMNDITINKPDVFEYDEDGTIVGILDDTNVVKWVAIGDNLDNPFKGNLDGNGHSIIGLYTYERHPGYMYEMGLFGRIIGGSVKNLSVVDGYLSDFDDCSIGGIAGYCSDCVISNCYNSCTIACSGCSGGIVGNVGENSTITGCYNTGKVSSGDYLGGIAGRCNPSYGNIHISECYNSGSISGRHCVGGIVGEMTSGSYADSCYNSGNIVGASRVGGIAGADGNVSKSYNCGSVSGDISIGGIVGITGKGDYSDCYNSGEIHGNSITGGIIGEISVERQYVEVSSCYNIGVVNCDGEKTGGIIGRMYSTSPNFYAYDAMTIKNCYYLENTASVEVGANEGIRGKRTIINVTSLTDEQMKSQESFEGFDFERVWTFDEAAFDYPYPVLQPLYGIYLLIKNSVSAIVLDEDGNMVTNGFSVFWYEKGSDIAIANGNTIQGLEDNQEYEFEVVLGEELSYLYKQPARQGVILEEGSDTITVQLESHDAVTVAGKVTDNDNYPLSGAAVTFRQIFNKAYSKETEVFSDENGEFTAQIANVPTEAIVSADGYYNRIRTVIISSSEQSSINLGTFSLVNLPANKITLNLTLVKAAAEGEEGELTQILSANSLSFSLYNQTQRRAIDGFTVQYPYIYLEDDAADADDDILIDITDNERQMTAPQQMLKLDAQKTASCTVGFIENGKFHIASVDGNEANTLMLFDASGKFVSSESVFSDYSSKPLSAGNYTAVFIKKTDLLRSVSDISKLAEFGLADNLDYFSKSIVITDGRITEAGDVDVPPLDESKLYYTVPEKTMFTAGANSAAVGRYIVMRCAYEIDEKYDSDEEKVLIDLPEGIDFVGSSLTVDGKIAAYSRNGSTIEVVTDKRVGVIRFYTVATEKGQKNTNVTLSFKQGDNVVTQPIGTVTLTAEDGKIIVPKKTARTKVTATGTTLSDSTVTVFDNDTEVGTTQANKAGNWSLTFELVKPYSYSYHEIYAQIENNHIDNIFKTAPQTICYDKNCIEVSKVTMINTAHPAGSSRPVEFCTVFDFLNPGTNIPVYNYWPAFPTFTFMVEFTGGDDTMLSDVYVVTTNDAGDLTYVPVVYDQATDLWLGTYNYNSSGELPVFVDVDFTRTTDEARDFEPDEEMIQDDLDYYKEEVKNSGFDISSIYVITVNRDNNNKTKVKLTPKNNDAPPVEFEHEKTTDELTPKQAEEKKEKLRSEGYSEKNDKNGDTTFTKEGERIKFHEGDGSGSSGDPSQGGGDTKTTKVETEKGKFSIDLDPQSPGAQSGGYGLSDWLDLTSDILGLGSSFIPGPAGQGLGVALGTAGMIKDGFTVGNLRKELTSNYEAYVELVDMSYRYLYKKCPDGKPALTKEQMQNYSSRLEDLTRQYDEQKKALLNYLDRFHFANILLSGVSTGVGAADLPDGFGVSMGVGDFIYARGSGGTYSDIARSIWQLDHDMKALLGELINEIVNAYRCQVEPDNPSKKSPGMGLPATYINDPSGYIYEAVPSNRLEDVKAEAYYYDYAVDEFGVAEDEKTEILWNAEAYNQVNPLYTDAYGMYAWDVPMGQWLVKYSKEGYYDTDSRASSFADDDGYLPVPPPQTEVNIGMVSKSAPTVESVNVYDSEIRIEFSQYMQIDSVNNDTVTVKMNGKTVSGTITPVNAEYDYEQVHQYASIFSFVPSTSVSGKINVTVSNAVNYAGTKMTFSFTESNQVAVKPESLVVKSEISVAYNSGALLEIDVLPKEAGAGLTLDVYSSSPSIVGIANSNIVTDENGHANVMILGDLPGEAEITVSVVGTELIQTARAKVAGVVSVSDRCEKVTANIASGSTVEAGTLLELSTDTEGAEIYYTLDGTCPCTIDSPSRIKYTGPIAINENTFVIAYAVKEGMQESYTAGFNYFVPAPIIDLLLGDVDGDGTVTIIDATYIQRQLASIPIPFVFNDDIADTDQDGSVTILDATYIQRWLASLPSNNNIGKLIS